MKRKPLLIILFLPVVVCALAWYLWFSSITTVILVRHAERLNATDTTSISEAGIQRAHALAHVLSRSGLTRIYVSEKQRTGQTAAPTAVHFSIVPVQIPAAAFQRYADSVKAHRGEVVLIVGHSDTLPQLLEKLGIKNPPTIPSGEFDNLFIITMFRFRSALTQLKFGVPS